MMIITRFAPSPTGDLHIGGARTALFNYLYSKRNGGKFLLRIEDTDKSRSTDESVASIFDGLAAINLTFDGDPVYQSKNADRHAAVVADLLASGYAYRCYNDADGNAADKVTNCGFRSKWRIEPNVVPDTPFVVRLRVPEDESIVIHDQVKGDVVFNSSIVDDIVLLRSDGSPTYNLAVVVDDHDMGITNVIRGDDHMVNTAKQYMIYKLLGWDVPNFAHVPMILGPDGQKYSKRHGAANVSEYIDAGYLPEALVNYLCHLSWSYGSEDVFTLDEAIAKFDIADVKSSPARFDFKKLDSINAAWMRKADDKRLAALVAGDNPTPAVVRGCEVLKAKVSTIVALGASMAFASNGVTSDAYSLLPDRDMAISVAGRFDIYFSQVHESVWNSPDKLHERVKNFIEQFGYAMKEFGPVVRILMTGGKVSPEINNVMYILGKEETLKRIRAFVREAASA